MNKITVIQLLNKKANREQVPEKIKYLESIWEWSNLYFDYTCDEQNSTINDEFLFRGIFSHPKNRLNDEVEIIEEDKEIEKINSIKVPTISNSIEKNIENIEETLNKYWSVINKLTEAVNELKKGK